MQKGEIMRKVQVLFNDSDEAVVMYYQTLDHHNFMGYELKSNGERYVKVNWAISSTKGDYGFFYPMVGGKDCTVYNYGEDCVQREGKMKEMAKIGTFYLFDTAKEMYCWLGEK